MKLSEISVYEKRKLLHELINHLSESGLDEVIRANYGYHVTKEESENLGQKLKTEKMKITVSKIKKILEAEYGWDLKEQTEATTPAINAVIRDTLLIVDSELRRLKNISIK